MSVTPLPPTGLDAIRGRHAARLAAAADDVTVTVEAIDADTGERILGSIVPRLYTPPLRDLTPDTTYGYDLIEFAAWLGWPLDPWQEWLAIHMGELLPDGRPRFRVCLVLVARQNGKTIFCQVLTLYWMLVEQVPLIIGTNSARDTAKTSWRAVVDFALGNEAIRHRFGKPRETIGEEAFTARGCATRCELDHEHNRASTYRFAAPNRRAGRSKTVHRAILDEFREHQTWDTWDALINAMNAVRDAQAVAITNQGDALSVPLDAIRSDAIDFLETGTGDSRLFLAEWSSPSGSKATDLAALAMANPDLNRRQLDQDNLLGLAIGAENTGGERLARFKTEVMCMRVALLNPAVDPDSWAAAGVSRETWPDLAAERRRLALCLDVSLDATHASLAAAVTIDGITYVEMIKAWQGEHCTRDLRADLPDLVAKIRPKTFSWFPDGPGAVVTADLRKRRGGRPWAPRGTKVEELRGDAIAAVCMGFADRVSVGAVRHARDPLLNTHVDRTQKHERGETWTFTRAGSEPVDATYAAAGAAHVARTLRAPRTHLAAAGQADGPPAGA